MPAPLLALLTFVSAATGSPAPPSLEQIVDRTIERAACGRIEEEIGSFWLELTSAVVKLDAGGVAGEVEERRYEIGTFDGESDARLVERNGRPAAPGGSRAVRERRERRARRKASAPDNEDDRVPLDARLVDRDVLALEGTAESGGRPAYVVWFRPRPGNLEQARRVDRALNQLRGRAWIDAETYEIAALDFELTERIKLWWGIAGSVSVLRGHLEQVPAAAGGAWVPSRFELEVHGRVLVRSIHQLMRLSWRDLRAPHAAAPRATTP